MNCFNKLLMLKNKTTFFVFAVVFFIAASCNKEKKMGEKLNGTTWEITSLSINDVEKLGQFYEDSCLPKILKFKSPGLYQSLIFTGFNPDKYTGEIKTEYNLARAANSRKEFYFSFKSYSHFDSNCTCGRFSFLYSTSSISNIKLRIEKDETLVLTMIYPEANWVLSLKKI